ncbi:MAG: MmgE/PrpD family protein, partial [Clostridia bacterium]|nr:MmgE/PrpD family protein [Clostridia bacterium]
MSQVSVPSITESLAEFFLSLKAETVPSDVSKKAIELIVDTIGVGINGSAHKDGQPVLNVVLASGGAEESVVWGHRARVPTHAAAFVNGTFTHCIELDDTHRATYLHAGAFVIPTALAVAEKTGASGKDFLLAVIAGYETAIRIALSVSPEHRLRGFHTTGTVGVFGAAMAASLLLKLNRKQTINAMGLAGTQSAGLFQFLYDGSMAKRFHPGRSAQSGILAALLAEKGFTG